MSPFFKAMLVALAAGLFADVAVQHVGAGMAGAVIGMGAYMLPNPIQQRRLKAMEEREELRRAGVNLRA